MVIMGGAGVYWHLKFTILMRQPTLTHSAQLPPQPLWLGLARCIVSNLGLSLGYPYRYHWAMPRASVTLRAGRWVISRVIPRLSLCVALCVAVCLLALTFFAHHLYTLLCSVPLPIAILSPVYLSHIHLITILVSILQSYSELSCQLSIELSLGYRRLNIQIAIDRLGLTDRMSPLTRQSPQVYSMYIYK